MEENNNIQSSDNQTESVNIAELERATNLAGGWELAGEQEKNLPNNNSSEPDNNNIKNVAEEQQSTPTEKAPSGKVDNDNDFSTLSETPYKSVKDIVKGYKSLQGELTKKSERFKNFESTVNRLETDESFKKFYEQALMLYDNPQLAQAYMNPQAGKVQSPNPRDYDLYSDEGMEKYNQDLNDYLGRQLDERINARFKSIDQRDAVDKARLHLKEVFPEANAEEVEKFIVDKNGKWNLSDVYKIMAFDKLKENAVMEARKNIQNKMDLASNASPAVSAASSSVNSEDVVRHIIKHGIESARKKYGARETMSAQSDYTNNNSY